MSAITAAHLRELRQRIVDPHLADTQRNFRAWEYLDAAEKAPPLVVWLSHLFDGIDRAERRQLRAALREVADRSQW